MVVGSPSQLLEVFSPCPAPRHPLASLGVLILDDVTSVMEDENMKAFDRLLKERVKAYGEIFGTQTK